MCEAAGRCIGALLASSLKAVKKWEPRSVTTLCPSAVFFARSDSVASVLMANRWKVLLLASELTRTCMGGQEQRAG